MIYYIFATLLLCANSIIQTSEPDSLSATEQLFRHIILNEPGAEYPNTYAWKCLDTRTISLLACINKEWKALHGKYIENPRNEFIAKHNDVFSIRKNTLIFNPTTDYFFAGSDKYTRRRCVVWGSGDDLIIAMPGNAESGLQDPTNISTTPITVHNKQGVKQKNYIFQVNGKYDNNSYLFMPNENAFFPIGNINVSFYDHDNSKVLPLQSCGRTLELVIQHFFDLSENAKFWSHHFKHDALTMLKANKKYEITIKKETAHFENAFTHIHALNRIAKQLDTPCTDCLDGIHNKCLNDYNTILSLLDQEELQNNEYSNLKKICHRIFTNNHTWHTTPCSTNNNEIICVNGFKEIGLLQKIGKRQSINTKHQFYFFPESRANQTYDDITTYPQRAQNYAASWKTVGSLNLTEEMKTSESTLITFHEFSNNTHRETKTELSKDESIERGITILIKDTIVVVTKIKNLNELLFLRQNNYQTMQQKNFTAENIQGLKQGFIHYAKKIKKANNFTYRVKSTSPTEIEQFFTFLETEMPTIITKILDKANYNPFDHTT